MIDALPIHGRLSMGARLLQVGYLSFMQWNDGRQEKKDLEEAGRAKVSSPSNAAAAKKAKAKKESDRVRKRDKARATKGKGFSKRVRAEFSDDDE